MLSDYEMSCGPVGYIPLFKARSGCFQELFVSLDGKSPPRVATMTTELPFSALTSTKYVVGKGIFLSFWWSLEFFLNKAIDGEWLSSRHPKMSLLDLT